MFGRNLDLDVPFPAKPILTPRNFPLRFRLAGDFLRHYSLFGMATVLDGYPLYADAVNEKGLAMAGLNFPENAFYTPESDQNRHNVSPFELIPWVLAQCKTCKEAKLLLQSTNLIAIPFRKDVPITPLHWHIADATHSIVLERTKEGSFIYENPYGVLANNPPFPAHVENAKEHERAFLAPERPMQDAALPGGFSSPARFLRAAVLRKHTPKMTKKMQTVTQFFDILSSVAPVRGAVVTNRGTVHETLYTCCFHHKERTCYLRERGNFQVRSFSFSEQDEEGTALKPLSPSAMPPFDEK